MAQNQQFKMKELRVVVFGGKFAGKSSLINSMFGKDLVQTQTRTAQCKKLQGSVCGRYLTLVDTPGWWKHFPLSDTATFLKKELVQGISLCQPGPHAVLLVIEIDIPFTEKHRKAAEEHLGLLGDQIWKHVLVLFSRGQSLKAPTIEEHIKKEGEALQRLIEKCGNRYHVFDNTVRDKVPHISQLLEKIEKVVERNSGACFQIEAKILQEALEWRNNVITKANNRQLQVQKQKTDLKKDELRITLVGWVIAGKSSAGNIILNKKEFYTGASTISCQWLHGEVDGRPVTVCDTPSWFKYFSSQYTPKWIRSEIIKGVSQISPHCILLVIPADTSFKEEQKKIIEENMSLLGEQVWRHTIVLFTWGDILGDVTIEQHIESEGDALLWVIEKCEYRYHVFNNEKEENRIQVTELLEKIDEMVSRNSVFQLRTQIFSEVTARNSADTPPVLSPEGDLQNIVRILDEEWRRRDRELHKKVLEIKRKLRCVRGDDSIEHTPYFEDKDLNEKSQREAKSCVKFQSEDKSGLTLKDQVIEMFDLEWSMREEALMGRFNEMLSEFRCETPFEPTEPEKKRSERKVEKIDEMVSKSSVFQLSTQKLSEVTVRYGADTQSDLGLDSDLQNTVQILDEERRRRDKELLKKILEIQTLKDPIKEMFNREWSRREEALMGRFMEMLSEFRRETLSEPTEKKRSKRKAEKIDEMVSKSSVCQLGTQKFSEVTETLSEPTEKKRSKRKAEKIEEMVSKSSVLQLSTQKLSEVSVRNRADTQPDLGLDRDLQNTVQILDEERRQRDEELLKKVLEIQRELCFRRGDESIEHLVDFKEEDLNEKEESQREAKSCVKFQSEDKSGLTLKDQVMEMFNREWSRREEALMGRFNKILSEFRSETSEPTERERIISERKVSEWLRKFSEGYGSLPDSSTHGDT